MDQILCAITIMACLLCALYFFMFASFSYGWMMTKEQSEQIASSVFNTNVTVVVPARNEENSIAACLDSLIAQDYPVELIRFIIADDHSTDGTANIIKKYTEKYLNVKYIHPEGEGKKNAIAGAVRHSAAEIIITTDADCRMKPGWVKSIVSFYKKSNAKMIVSPVMFEDRGSVFEKLQSLEFLALMGSTCGSLFLNKHILCNGANLAYQRDVFNEMNGFEGIDSKPSGDDVLLMYKIAKKYPQGIKFLKNRAAIITTASKETFGEFMNQRKRWASKGAASMNAETKFVSIVVYMFSLLMLLMWLLSPFATLKTTVGLSFLEICLILSGIKCVIDFLLLFLAASFFRRRQVLYLFLPAQFIYILYVAAVGLLGSKGRFEWKGRKF